MFEEKKIIITKSIDKRKGKDSNVFEKAQKVPIKKPEIKKI